MEEKDKERVKRIFEEGKEKVTEEDLEKVLEDENRWKNKVSDVPAGKFEKFINQLKLTWELLNEYYKGTYRNIPWATIAALVFAALYFLSPIDIIPDFLPIVGFIDDAFVFWLAFKAVERDLKKYCEHKGYELANYF